ncbi:TIGR04282 family arsenosugar biosynthesis glycosyltransferase [Spirochaetota bacterium]
MTEKAIIFFFKYPQKGQVKTRLAASLGDELTCTLYGHFISDILKACMSAHGETVLAFSKSGDSATGDIPGTGSIKSFEQRGDDLGQRMFNAFVDTRKLGFKKAVIIGSDLPHLSTEILNNTLNLLDEYSTVVGPSTDGGYYLLGIDLNDLNARLFDAVPWSTGEVLNITIERINEMGSLKFLLPEMEDVDDMDSLKRFYFTHKDKGSNLDSVGFLKENENRILKLF